MHSAKQISLARQSYPSTGMEVEDKYRLLHLPLQAQIDIGVPAKIKQGYLTLLSTGVVRIIEPKKRTHSSYLLEVSLKGTEWQTEMPPWVAKIIANGKGREFRLRVSKEGGETTYTGAIKSKGRLSRAEWQVNLPVWVAEYLWPFTKKHRIFKTRYTIAQEERVIHLDIFERHLTGLVIAEVESPSKDSARTYRRAGGPSSLLGPCVLVTYDTRHRHRRLMKAKCPPESPLMVTPREDQ